MSCPSESCCIVSGDSETRFETLSLRRHLIETRTRSRRRIYGILYRQSALRMLRGHMEMKTRRDVLRDSLPSDDPASRELTTMSDSYVPESWAQEESDPGAPRFQLETGSPLHLNLLFASGSTCWTTLIRSDARIKSRVHP